MGQCADYADDDQTAARTLSRRMLVAAAVIFAGLALTVYYVAYLEPTLMARWAANR
jgi:hypothetical protein